MMQKWDSTSQYLEWKCNYDVTAAESVEPDNTDSGLDLYDPFEVSNVDNGDEYGIEEDPTNTNNEVFR